MSVEILVHECTCTDAPPGQPPARDCAWCKLTPRERQVHRYEAADAMFQEDVKSMGLDAAAHEFDLPASPPLIGGLTAQQEQIARDAIVRFVGRVRGRLPWTGLGDIKEGQIQAFVDEAISDLLR